MKTRTFQLAMHGEPVANFYIVMPDFVELRVGEEGENEEDDDKGAGDG